MSGRIVLPGLIDPHVHLRDPGQTNKEDFYTGTCAALAGGFTTVLDMPNNKAPITTAETLNEKIKIAQEKIVCDVGFYFGSLEDNFLEFPKIINKVAGLKLYLNETTGNFLIGKSRVKEIFESWKSAKPILLHAENEMVDYVIGLVKKTGVKIHLCHISTESDLKQIIKAKNNGLPVTCGVTPHHLFLTNRDVKRLGHFGKMKPALSSKKDQDFLWKNLKFIDVVESDHAPHTIEEKGSDNPPFGVPGLETALPLLLTAVSEKRLMIDDIIRLCHTNPARIFNIKTDSETFIEVYPNWKFEIVRFAPFRSHRREACRIEASARRGNWKFHTKCGWSPFAGMKVKGKVEKVWIRGKKVFENGRIFAQPGFGKIID